VESRERGTVAKRHARGSCFSLNSCPISIFLQLARPKMMLVAYLTGYAWVQV
jgi:hypothetical protein